MQCSVMTRLAAAATVAGGVLAMLGSGVSAAALPGTVLIDIAIDSPVAAAVSDALVLELFATEGGADAGGGCTLNEEQFPSGSSYQAHWTCAVPLASYELGITGVPIGHEVTASCLPPVTERIGDGKGGFVTVELSASFPRQECAIEIVYREALEPGATTTSTASTTTTTPATTTTAAPIADTLPATGAAQRTALTSALAAVLVLAGAALLATRRRPS